MKINKRNVPNRVGHQAFLKKEKALVSLKMLSMQKQQNDTEGNASL